MTIRNLLVICGVSGSGKSTLEQNLIETFPQVFHKWQQVTTRKPRVGESAGNPYIFLGNSGYDNIKEVLVGRLGLAEGSIFKDRYGSIPDFVDGKVSTVILAEEGINDLKDALDSGRLQVDNVFILGLDVSYENLLEKDLREGRNEEFLNKERTVLKKSSMIFKVDNGKYMNPNTVVNILRSEMNLQNI